MHTVFAIIIFIYFSVTAVVSLLTPPDPVYMVRQQKYAPQYFHYCLLFYSQSFLSFILLRKKDHMNIIQSFLFILLLPSFHMLFFPLQLVRTTFKTRKDKTPRQDEIRREKDMELCPLEGEIERTQKGQVRYGALSVRR